MSDAITSRIAAIVNEHTMWPSLGGGGFLQCVCGLDELLLSQYSAHVAEVIVEQLGLTPAPGLIPTPYWVNWSAEDKQKCHNYTCGHMRGDHSAHTDVAPCLQSLCLCDEFLEERENDE